MRLVWTEPALQDLVSLRGYNALDDDAVARRQVELILAAVEHLRRFPETGRPGRRTGTRALIVARTPYLVPYRIRQQDVEILRVLHTRQRWPDRR
jgi:toxin ParE1/3/4